MEHEGGDLMQELTGNPLVIDFVAGGFSLAAACAGLVKGLYKQIMPFAVVTLALLGAIVLSATLTTPVTEMIFPKIVAAYVKDDGRGLDIAEISREAQERLRPLVPRKLLDNLDEAERSGVLGDTVTEIFQDASDNDLGDAVNDVLNQAAESETGEKLRDVGDIIGNLNETAGDAIRAALDAARDGAAGNAIDSALGAAADGVVGDAMNDTVRTARIEITKAIAEQTAAYVRLLLLCILWVAMMVALTIIKNTFGLAAKLPVVKQADRLGGAALGLVECAMVFWGLAWVDKITGLGWLAQQAQGTVFLRLFV